MTIYAITKRIPPLAAPDELWPIAGFTAGVKAPA
jgi:hypothetical protein